mgnify:CR=1 FL=1
MSQLLKKMGSYPEIMGKGICFYVDVEPVVEEVKEEKEDKRQLQFSMEG